MITCYSISGSCNTSRWYYVVALISTTNRWCLQTYWKQHHGHNYKQIQHVTKFLLIYYTYKNLPFETSVKGDCCLSVVPTGVTWSQLVCKPSHMVLLRLRVSLVLEASGVVDAINILINNVRKYYHFYKVYTITHMYMLLTSWVSRRLS